MTPMSIFLNSALLRTVPIMIAACEVSFLCPIGHQGVPLGSRPNMQFYSHPAA
jgi:hypothetical protein